MKNMVTDFIVTRTGKYTDEEINAIIKEYNNEGYILISFKSKNIKIPSNYNNITKITLHFRGEY